MDSKERKNSNTMIFNTTSTAEISDGFDYNINHRGNAYEAVRRNSKVN